MSISGVTSSPAGLSVVKPFINVDLRSQTTVPNAVETSQASAVYFNDEEAAQLELQDLKRTSVDMYMAGPQNSMIADDRESILKVNMPPSRSNRPPEDCSLAKDLAVMVPPKAPDGKKYPGHWEAPDGYGDTVTGVDSFFWAIWWFWRCQRQAFLKCIAVILCQDVIAFFSPLATSSLLSSISDNSPVETFLQNLIIVALLEVSVGILEHRLKLFTPSGGGFRPGTMGALVDHFLNLPLHRAEDVRPGSVMPVLQAFTLIDTNIDGLIMVLSAGSILIFSFAAFSSFSPDLIALQLASFLLMGLYISRTAGDLSAKSEDHEKGTRVFMNEMEELLDLRLSISFLRIKEFSSKRIADAIVALRGKFKALKLCKIGQIRMLDFISVVGAILILGYGGWKVRDSNLPFGELVTFFSFHEKLLKTVTKIIDNARKMQIAAAHLKTVSKVLRLHSVQYPEVAKTVTGHIQVRNVNFGYRRTNTFGGNSQENLDDEATGKREVLHDVSVEIPAGSKVAVVGRSGTGKSTLLRLLARGYQPDSGFIKVGGEFLNCIDLKRNIAVCEQSANLFETTVLENIRVGTDATEEECEVAAKKACLIGMVDSLWSLPQGLLTPCGPGGKNLSGGMLQRVLIARAIVRNCPIVILDEPLSAQDEQTRAVLMRNLLSLTHTVSTVGATKLERPSTVILTTHTMEGIDQYSAILYIQHGELKDYGSHDQLMKSKGAFWQFRFRAGLVDVNMFGQGSITPAGLQRVWPLAEVPVDELYGMVNLFTSQTFNKGEVITCQGDENVAMLVVASGECSEFFNIKGSWGEQYKEGQERPGQDEEGGSEHGVFIREMVAGDYTNAGAVYRHLTSLEDRPQSNMYTLVAKSKCTLLLLQNQQCKDLFKKNPDIQTNVVDTVKRRDETCKEALAKVWQLATVSAAELEGLARLADTDTPQPNETFYVRGESQPALFIVMSGQVNLKIKGQKDPEPVQVGASFGMERLVGGEPQAVLESATAVGSVELLVVRKGLFDSFMTLPSFKAALDNVSQCLQAHKNTDRLSKAWPFRGLSEHNLDILARNLEPEVHRKDSLVISTFVSTKDVFILAHGTVEIIMETSEGVVVSKKAGPGVVFNDHCHLHLEKASFKLLNVKCLSDCVVLRARQRFLIFSKEFLPKWTEDWERTFESKQVAKALAVHPVEGSIVCAFAPFELAVLSMGTEVQGFVSQPSDRKDSNPKTPKTPKTPGAESRKGSTALDGDPLVLFVVYGSMKFAGLNGDAVEVSAGSVVMNGKAQSFLRGKSQGVVQARVVATEIAVSSEECLFAVVSLEECLAGDMLAKSKEIRRLMAEEEEQRLELVVKAMRLQQECLDMERKLAWAPIYLGPKRTWRIIICTLSGGGMPTQGKARRASGVLEMSEENEENAEVGEKAEGEKRSTYDPMRFVIRQCVRGALLKVIRFYQERIDFISPHVQKNLSRLRELRAEWERIGLKLEGKRSPDKEHDLSEERLQRIDGILKQRKKQFQESMAKAKEEFETLGLLLEFPEDAWNEKRALVNKERGMNSLTAIERQVETLRLRAEPLADKLNESVSTLYEEMEIPESQRTPLLSKKWTVSQIYLFSKQEAALRAAKVFCDKVASDLTEVHDNEKKEHDLERSKLRDTLAQLEKDSNRQLEIERSKNKRLETEMEQLSSDMSSANETIGQAKVLERDFKAVKAKLARVEEDLKIQEAESEDLRKSLMELRVSSMSNRTNLEDFKGKEAEILSYKVPGSHSQLAKESADLCQELGVPEELASSLSLKVPPPPTGAKEDAPVKPDFRSTVLKLQEHMKLRLILHAYDKLSSLWTELGIVNFNDKKEALAQGLQANPMDSMEVSQSLEAIYDQELPKKTDRQKLRKKLLKKCEDALTAVNSKRLYDDIKTTAMASITSENMEQLQSKVKQLESWVKVQEYDNQLVAIDEKAAEDIKGLNRKQKKVVKAEALKEREAVIALSDELENEFGRAPGSSRPSKKKAKKKKKAQKIAAEQPAAEQPAPAEQQQPAGQQ